MSKFIIVKIYHLNNKSTVDEIIRLKPKFYINIFLLQVVLIYCDVHIFIKIIMSLYTKRRLMI